jgi:uncharacterized membrane protein YoaT (DUF817 family)
MRNMLFIFVAAAFGPTWVYFRPYRTIRRMPLLVGFGLVALFIWGAENIGTFAAVWIYPSQRNGWQLVNFNKYGAWFLLMIISFILVSFVHPPRLPSTEEQESPIQPEMVRSIQHRRTNSLSETTQPQPQKPALDSQ